MRSVVNFGGNDLPKVNRLSFRQHAGVAFVRQSIEVVDCLKIKKSGSGAIVNEICSSGMLKNNWIEELRKRS